MPRVRFGPDAFVLYPGGVRRAAIELLDALRAIHVPVSVAAHAEQHARAGDPAVSTTRRALYQIAESNFMRRTPPTEKWVAHSLYFDPLQISSGRPRIVTVNDMIHERFSVGRTLQAMKRRAIASADCIITPSAATARDVRRVFKHAPDCMVVPYGISPTMLAAPRCPTQLERPYLLFVGPRRGYKNFRLLVEALPQLERRGLSLVLVGGEQLPDWERRELAIALGSGDALIHVRPDDAGLAGLYDGASALVITSKCEGFGFPLLEAMARGCPVASSSGGSLREVAGGHASLFSSESPAECAAAIENALEMNSADRVAASNYARRFTWLSSANLHAEIYRTVQPRRS